MDLSGVVWRRSSFSGEDGGAWIEIAFLPGSKESSDHVIAMRDGSDPDGPGVALPCVPPAAIGSG
jgi:hypothetical protein